MLVRSELGQRSETVRRSNLSAIVRALHLHGPLSRSDLVARTGLTRSAIRGLIGELVAGGLAIEGPAVLDGSPGRPSPVVRLDPDGARVLALEIAADSLAVASIGLGGDVEDLVRLDLSPEQTSVEDVTAVLHDMAAPITERPGFDDALVGVGVAVVGVVRRRDGLVFVAPNLGWRDEPLGEMVARVMHARVPVAVANDADLAALAESRRGAARGVSDAIVIWASVGVGGGLIVDGVQPAGASGHSGEVGHIPVNPDGLPCRCGSTGCWETEVGTGAVLRRAGYPPEAGSAGLDAVIRDATAGSPIALAALAETGRWLGIGLSGLINALDPRVVLLGGRLALIHPFIRAALEAELDRRVLRAARQSVRVVPASLGIDAPLIGASELAFEPLLNDPSGWLRHDEAMSGSATA